jgi:hypothetical protein
MSSSRKTHHAVGQSNWLRKSRALKTAGLPALKQSTPSKGRSINLERKVNPQEDAE